MLIGARNCFFVVDLTYPFAQQFATKNWTIPQDKITDCLIKGEEEWECQNFVQVIEFDVETNRLVVCGTGAQAPVCRIYPVGSNLSSVVSFVKFGWDKLSYFYFLSHSS